MDCSPSGSFVHGILQARILEWIAMPSSRGSSTQGLKINPGIEPMSLTPLALADRFFTTSTTWEVKLLSIPKFWHGLIAEYPSV